MVEVRFFKKTEKDILLKAIDTLWRKDHIYVRNPAVMDHLVLNTPWKNEIAKEDEYAFLGMWYNGELIGIQGLMPQEANIFGETVKAQTGTIWIVKKQKSHSIDGLVMGEFANKIRPQKFGFAMGYSKRVEKIYKISGAYVNSDMPRWVAFCRVEEAKRVFHLDESVDLVLPLARKSKFEGRCSVEIDSLDESTWNEYYMSVVAPKTIGIRRDYKFLHWRYGESPVLRYHFITVRGQGGNYLGLAVVRKERILNKDFSIGRILEFISFDAEASVQLANAILDFDNDVLLWDFYCLSDVTAFGLEMVGFQKIPSWDNKIKIPTRYQPLDNNITKINVAVYMSEEIKEVINPIDASNWYMTKGDSDQDRAN